MMRITAMTLLMLTMTVALAQKAEDPAVLEVTGRGVEGRAPYDGGGKLRFTDISIGAQVVHYDGGDELMLPLTIRYEVLQPAPIMLTSRMGTEYWRLYHFGAETISALHTYENIDLSEPGAHTATPENLRAWFDARQGAVPARGLVGIRGHYYFLVEPAGGGDYIDITNPPPWFDTKEVGRKLTFTLADLSGPWGIKIADFQSTWQPGGPLRVRVTVTDAAGDTFPLTNLPLTVSAGDWQAALETEWGPTDEPTGWLRATLPQEVPERITISGTVTAFTPDGLQERSIEASFTRGEGRVSAAEMEVAEQGYELPRNADGVIRETRAIWASTSDFEDAAAVDRLVDRCSAAGLNMIVADVFVRNNFMARSDLLPWTREKWTEFDPLAYLIEKAHAAGIEVHPWFCVSYRDPAFNEWFEQTHGVDVRLYRRDGQVDPLASDVHRDQYRDFIVNLMVGVARDYDVDGIHLDYIRSKGQCFCEHCRRQFQEKFGKPLTEATEEDWIAWQREAIGDIVRRTAEGVREVRPGAIMSAAVFANMRGGAIQGQDPAAWARAGWLDLVIPMDYAMQTVQVRAHERQFLEALDDDDKLVTGLSLYQRGGNEVSSRPPELVRDQIELVRTMGIHGYCLFAFSHLSDEQLEMLRNDINAEPAVPYFR